MRLKIPGTLVLLPRGSDVVVYNYVTKMAICCPPDTLSWLFTASDWIEPASLPEGTPIEDLLETSMLIQENSPAAHWDCAVTTGWKLGSAAAMFHFTLLDTNYGSLTDSQEKQRAKQETDPSPALFWRNGEAAIDLKPHETKDQRGAIASIMARRSNRNVSQNPIPFAALATCLAAGFGLTGFVEVPLGFLPLKPAPSGGARNPYEAFVSVRAVDGLEPGLYHYSAFDHTLEQVADPGPSDPIEMLAGQDWAAGMAALIFFVAVLERTTWKYEDPNAYRVVVIEAGHIAQNVLLAAHDCSIAACPTGAIAHSPIKRAFNLDKPENLTHTPVYCVGLGDPIPSTDRIISNHQFEELQAQSSLT
jgi:SagB-type dehydrogenase family enzyme